MANEHGWAPTIKASHDFRADIDAQNVYDAVVGGKGPDFGMITEVLTKRSNFQRQLIKAGFEHKYKQTFEEAIARALKGDYLDTLKALLDPPDIYDAKMVHASFSRGTSDLLLIDILCTKDNDEIRRLQNAYRSVYGKSLVDAVKSNTSSDLRKLLLPIANGDRSDDEAVDANRARRDANHLFEAGENKMGTDEDTFQAILGLQNYKQLGLVMKEYEGLTKHGLDEAINKEFSGTLKHAYMTILQCIKNHHVYFSNAVYQSMKGLGTSEDRLTWLITSRSEIDLEEIKQTYERLFRRTLDEWVANDTTGPFRDLLLQVLRGNIHQRL